MNRLDRPNRNKYENKPDNLICYRCEVEKPFTEEFFMPHKHSKFGLVYLCRECTKLRKDELRTKFPDEHRTRRKNWSETNKKEGKCIKCSSLRLENSNNFCEKHYLQDVSHKYLGTKKRWVELKDKLEEQNYKCHYSGVELILGINASVDHTKPSIKYPELKNDIDNIKWVDIRVNRMKRELDEDEFIDLCKKIISK